MPVHQVGLSADIDRINRSAMKFGLKVIEDAACALGSEYKGKKIGSLSSLSCFSFHPRKVISTGEGGMVTTNSRLLADKITSLPQHYAHYALRSGKACRQELFPRIGYNYRMTDIQAAIGLVQLSKISFLLAKRRRLALRYDRAFKDKQIFTVPHIPDYATPNYQSYILRINKNPSLSRDGLIRHLQKTGIGAKPGITSIHKQPCYQKVYGRLRLPVTEEATARTLMIPLYPGLKDKEQDCVIKAALTIARIER